MALLPLVLRRERREAGPKMVMKRRAVGEGPSLS